MGNLYKYFALALIQAALAQRPNVCKSFTDYMMIDNNKNCYYNPEFDLDVPDIIRLHGYPYEEHEVATADDYLITIHRMPRANPKGVIYFQPPALSSSIGMIDKGPNNSFGFMLWDAGYDVWMGNFRGNYFGRKHKYLNPNTSKEFWDYSFHEVGIYDIPAQLEYVANYTGAFPRKIVFVGYSMGGTAGLIYGSLLPEHAEKWTQAMILVGATSEMKHVYAQGAILPALMVNIFESIGEMFNINEILERGSIGSQIMSLCEQAPVMVICMISDLTVGYSVEDIPPEWYPLRYAHNPEGVSYHIFLHYLQLIKTKEFQYFDYGPAKNMVKYNSTTPPLYPLENFSTPVLLLTGEYDNICTPKDMEIVYKKFAPSAQRYGVVCQKKNSHGTFYYGSTATDYCYKPIIRFLDRLFKNSSEIQEVHIHCDTESTYS